MDRVKKLKSPGLADQPQTHHAPCACLYVNNVCFTALHTGSTQMGRSVGTVTLAALAAFAATNIDDFLVLVVFFAQVDGKAFTNYQVAAGQVLGFTVILAISLLGIVLGLFIPSGYIELLGFVPILIGLRQLYELVKPHCSRRGAATASSEQGPQSGDQDAVPAATGELATTLPMSACALLVV
jgi:Cadmium resistance transporter